jgi:hypothetical protein
VIVTPGPRVSFQDAKDGHDGTFTVETTSDTRRPSARA